MSKERGSSGEPRGDDIWGAMEDFFDELDAGGLTGRWRTDDLRKLQSKYAVSGILPMFGGQYPPGVAPDKRDGFHVTDPEGREYSDLHQAILSMIISWNNPRVERAVAAYLAQHPGVDMIDTTQYSEAGLLLLKDMVEALKPYGISRGKFASSGTAANNLAIRVCMGALGGEKETQLIVMDGGYGGADLAMNAKCMVPGLRGITSLENDALVLKRDFSNVDEVLAETSRREKKPLWHTEDGQQGVAGFEVLPADGMKYMAEEVTRRGGRKIYDNVQTFVRNGSGLVGMDRWSDRNNPAHQPDAFTFAKGLGNGRPVAAAMFSQEVLEACRDAGAKSGQGTGFGFDTFEQPTAGLRAARQVLRIVLEEKLWENCAQKGELFKRNLGDFPDRFPGVVQEIVGEGGLIAIQLATPELVAKALELGPKHGILMAKGGMPGAARLRTPLPANATDAFVHEVSGSLESLMRDLV